MDVNRTLVFALASALSIPASAKTGPEWTQIKSAETDMKSGQFPQAESELQQALTVNPDEPKIDEDLSLVHIVFDELKQARKDLQQAIDISKRKQAKYKKGGPPYKAWQKYLAELYSIHTELTILENEKILRPGLSKGKGKKPKQADLDKALAKVRSAYEKVKLYGSFKSRVDDDLIAKAITALSGHQAAKASAPKAADEDSSDEAAEEGSSAQSAGAEGGGDEDEGDSGGDDSGGAAVKADAGSGSAPGAAASGSAMSASGGGSGGGAAAPAAMTAAGGSSGGSSPAPAAGKGAKDDADPFAAMGPSAPSGAPAGGPAAGGPAAAGAPAKAGGDSPFGDAPKK